jgi:hypothetical protein
VIEQVKEKTRQANEKRLVANNIIIIIFLQGIGQWPVPVQKFNF